MGPPDAMRSATSLLLFLLAGFSSGCNTVEFYQQQAFTDPAMELDKGRAHTHWRQKVLYSMEGSAGGVGTTAGGGCGCY